VGSLRFDGVRFVAYPRDHEPCHVHGFYGETEAVVELLRGEPMAVRLDLRGDAVRPASTKRADVRHILDIAAAHVEELMMLWGEAHG
jgi:hypothetical protein